MANNKAQAMKHAFFDIKKPAKSKEEIADQKEILQKELIGHRATKSKLDLIALISFIVFFIAIYLLGSTMLSGDLGLILNDDGDLTGHLLFVFFSLSITLVVGCIYEPKNNTVMKLENKLSELKEATLSEHKELLKLLHIQAVKDYCDAVNKHKRKLTSGEVIAIKDFSKEVEGEEVFHSFYSENT